MKNKFLLACLICNVSIFASTAKAFGETYNVTTFSGSDNSIVSRPTPFVNGDILNLQNDLSATSNIDSLGAFQLDVQGNHFAIDGGTLNSGFVVNPGADYSFTNLKLNNFSSAGGGAAIYNVGTSLITGSSFSGNSSGSYGGVIDNRAAMTITDSTFISNITTGPGYGGGAIFNYGGTSDISTSIFKGNIANTGNGGGAIYNDNNCTATITNSIFGGTGLGEGNLARRGGAISNTSGLFTLEKSTFINNIADDAGGAIINYDRMNIDLGAGVTTFTNNSATNYGGAICNVDTLSLSKSVFKGNSTTSTSYGGGAIYSTGNATIAGSTFGGASLEEGNKAANGGAIFNGQNITRIYNSTFTNNSATVNGGAICNSASTYITNSTFANNSAGSNGGAIYNAANLIIIADNGVTSFSGNTAGGVNNAIYNTGTVYLSALNNGSIVFDDKIVGGNVYINDPGLFATSEGTIKADISNANVPIWQGTMVQSHFDNSYIYNSSYYGESFIKDSFFVNNSRIDYSSTPAMHLIRDDFSDSSIGAINNSGTLSIEDSHFNRNSGVEYGGALNNHGNAEITGTTFADNNSNRGGGAIINYATIKITDSTFTGNYEVGDNYGGGAVFNYGGTNDILRSTFKGNKVETGNAGALFNANGCITTIKDSTFGGTKAGDSNFAVNGGAIYNNSGSITIENSSFTNNKATSTGGAIFNEAVMTISGNSTFSGNISDVMGGAITNSNILTLVDVTIKDNRAGAYGGAMYNNYSADITNTNFIGNSAVEGGGAIINYGGLDIKDSTFIGNIQTGTHYGGGAIFNYGGTNSLTNTTFKGNSADLNNGGAIFNDSGCQTTIKDSTFGGTITGEGNSAINGGAIYNASGLVSVENTKFINNKASTDGGAIFNSANTNLLASTFSGNSATSNGGAIFNSSGAMSVQNDTFSNNLSTINGGAIYNYADLNILNTLFSSNSAKADGGAIYNNTGTVIATVEKTTFDGNSAINGGAVFNNSGTLVVKNSSFTNNSATLQGGAINNAATLNIVADTGNTTFTGNKAGGISNAIYNSSEVNLNAGNGGVITFNDKNTGGTFNVNRSDLGYAYNGNVIMNESLTNANLILNSGALILGEWKNNKLTDATGLTPSNSYFDNVNLALNGGVLNMANGNTQDVLNLNSFTSSANGSLLIDIDFTNNKNDTLSANSASGSLSIGGAHMYSDGANSQLTLFTGTQAPVLNAFNTYTSGYKYAFTPSATFGAYDIVQTSAEGLLEAILDPAACRSFSVTDNSALLSSDLTAMATGGSTLYIFGNNKNINGNDHAGFTVGAGQTANIINVGSLNSDGSVKTSFNGFLNHSAGLIYNCGNLNIENSIFFNNKSDDQGAVIYNTNIANITGSTFADNVTSSVGGAITNRPSAISNISNSTFSGNYSMDPTYGGGAIWGYCANINIADSKFNANVSDGSGGAIASYASSLIVTGSEFKDNIAANDGGAIWNNSTATITNGAFIGNIASGNGGAIYNLNILNLNADNGTMTFTGNKAGGVSNAVYNANQLNLNTGVGSSIIFNDRIISSNISNQININSGATLNSGTVVFNDNVSDSTVNLNGGTLVLGQTGSSFTNTYFTNVDLNLNKGSLNMSNGLATDVLDLNNFTSTANSKIYFDANLSNSQNDTINILGTASGALNIGGINIVADGTDSTLTLFNGTTAPSLSSFSTFTNNYQYIFTPDAAGGFSVIRSATATFNDIISSVTSPRTFSATDNLTIATANLGTMGGVNSTLNIFGNTHSINGAGYAGINVLDGQTLNISGVGSLNANGSVNNSWHNSVSTAGGVVNNSGTLAFNNNVFSNNRANTNGGVLNNTSIASITDSTLTSNNAQNGGAIYNTGRTNITNSTFSNNTATSNGGAIYNNGTLNVVNSSFTGNTAAGNSNSIYLAGGTLNLNSGNGGSVSFNDGIKSASLANEININKIGNGASGQPESGAPINGNVMFNNSVNNATLNVYNGTMSLNSGSSLTQDKLNIVGGTVNVVNNSLNTSNDINLAQGTLNLNAGNGSFVSLNDKIVSSLLTNAVNINKTGDGTSGQPAIGSPTSGSVFFNKSISNATLNVYNGTTQFAGSNSLINDKLNIYGGAVNFSNQNVNTSNDINLVSGTLNLNVANGNSIGVADKITSSALSNIININKTGDGTVGQPSIGAPTSGNVYLYNTISNSTLNLYNGSMAMKMDNALTGNNLNVYGGSISMINNSIGSSNLNTLNLANGTRTNLGIDVDLKNNLTDRLTATNVGVGTGILKINNINTIGVPSSSSASILLSDANLRDHISLGVTKISSPIFEYNLNYNPSTGMINFASGGGGDSGSFNPAVLTSPIQANTGNYLNQITSYQQAFYNMDSVMLLPNMVRENVLNRNKYADASGGPMVFSPIMEPEQSKGLWFRPYTTFENIPLNNGPKVSNIAYGGLIGGDSEFTKLKHGFYGVTTAYAGYNGSQQRYTGVSTSQNGGMLGLTETLYKGNFFSALTANVGANAGESYNTYGVDNFTMLTAGLASKTGYNFEVDKGKFIIQPSMLMSYTFANTFDYTNAAGVSITSDPINAFQLAPGVKFIANMNNGWQPYVGVSMVWNIMDQSRFYANNVALPSMSVKPYVEYGIGVQRHWGDRLTGFAQAMITNGGRNGVNLQLGFRWAF